MILLNSIILGLSMGVGAYLSIKFREKDRKGFVQGNQMAFLSIMLLAAALNLLAVLGIKGLLAFMLNDTDDWCYRYLDEYTDWMGTC